MRFKSWIGMMILSLCLALPPVSHAEAPPAAYQGLSGASSSVMRVQSGSGGSLSSQSLPEMIGRLIGAILGILGVILVFYIIQAGIKYMTANGDSKKTDDAKKMITTAVIGMIILIAAYSITSFVINTISRVGDSSPGATDIPAAIPDGAV